MRLAKAFSTLCVPAVFLAVLFISSLLNASEGRTYRGITAEGACAIVDMSAEQARQVALKKARSAAIEKAAGVKISSALLITSSDSVVELIRTYSTGYITREDVVWLPLGQYQKDSSSPPIPEYRVRIKADVYIPRRKTDTIGLKADINKMIYLSGEKALFRISAEKPAAFAIFNLTAEDRAVMIFPNDMECRNEIEAGKTGVFPSKDSPIEFEMQTFPGHSKDAEAFMVVAAPKGSSGSDFLRRFPAMKPMGLTDFFTRLAEISESIEETVIPYEVVKAKEQYY